VSVSRIKKKSFGADELCHSPACILSFLITAACRGELRQAWNWGDGPLVDTGRKTESSQGEDEKMANMLNETKHPESGPEALGGEDKVERHMG